MKSSSLKGITGWGNAFCGPKFISLLGPDLSLRTSLWVLTSFRTKLVPASSLCWRSTVASGILWVLSRHTLTSSLSVWGSCCFLAQSWELPICHGVKFSFWGVTGYYLVQVSKECRAKKMCCWPRRAYKEILFLFLNQIYPVDHWPPITSYFQKTYKNRRLLGMSRPCLVRATQRRHLGCVKYKCVVYLCQYRTHQENMNTGRCTPERPPSISVRTFEDFWDKYSRSHLLREFPLFVSNSFTAWKSLNQLRLVSRGLVTYIQDAGWPIRIASKLPCVSLKKPFASEGSGFKALKGVLRYVKPVLSICED